MAKSVGSECLGANFTCTTYCEVFDSSWEGSLAPVASLLTVNGDMDNTLLVRLTCREPEKGAGGHVIY